jgi:hypothetical protein
LAGPCQQETTSGNIILNPLAPSRPLHDWNGAYCNAGAFDKDGTWSNKSSTKSLWHKRIETTVHRRVDGRCVHGKIAAWQGHGWKQHVESRHIRSTFDGCGKFRGGSWAKVTSTKSLWYKWVVSTAKGFAAAIAYIKRSQPDNKTSKQDVESRLIRPILDAGAKYNGGTWNQRTNVRMMRHHVGNKTVNANLKRNGAETKPPTNSDPVTILHSKTVSDRCRPVGFSPMGN